MSLFPVLHSLERDDALHEARLLVLLLAFAGTHGTGSIEGVTKLAKVDFLLRYPTYLERALASTNLDPILARVAEYERDSIEASMVRFRYGPWDFRYRRLLRLLVAKGLVQIKDTGNRIRVSLTPEGVNAARILAANGNYSDVFARAELLKKHFDWGGTKLKEFIYRTFPEVVTLRLGEEIGP